MATYKLSKVWIRENNAKIKEAYSTAKSRGLDVSSEVDVLELLKIVDSENATEGNAKVFSKILQLFVRGVEKKFEPKPKIKQKTIH